MLNALIITLVVGTSIWVGIDAMTHKVPQLGQKQFGSQDPWIWAVCCLLLWIVVFPAYLIKRAVYAARDEVRQTTESIPSAGSAEELLKFKRLLDSGAITQDEFEGAKARILGTPAKQPAQPSFVKME